MAAILVKYVLHWQRLFDCVHCRVMSFWCTWMNLIIIYIYNNQIRSLCSGLNMEHSSTSQTKPGTFANLNRPINSHQSHNCTGTRRAITHWGILGQDVTLNRITVVVGRYWAWGHSAGFNNIERFHQIFILSDDARWNHTVLSWFLRVLTSANVCFPSNRAFISNF